MKVTVSSRRGRRVDVVTTQTNAKKCLRPGCDMPAVSRGLCTNCYAAAKYYVNVNKTSWAKLVSTGKAKPGRNPAKRESKYANWLLK